MRDVDVMIVKESGGCESYVESVRANSRLRLIDVASDPAEVHALIPEIRPSLLLVDVSRPAVDGLELLASVVSSGAPTSVIVLTSSSDMQLCSKALACGVFDYIIKPAAIDRLALTLERFVRFHDALGARSLATQSHIDALYRFQAKDFQSGESVRGFSDMTLQRVKDVFLSASGEQTTESVARTIGICKTTARRYLEHCVELRFLRMECVQGRVGRPERIYHRAG
ncbi:response regulator [Paludibacterium yongneupense]|uniref:response regulator n=1 Tax=Paludibacterium yongneupense TaxID=400061 RepID=UPI0003FF1B9E|nr:response regulator [Paludibacterium yongneupense]